jgi:HSP20 family protein
MSLIHYQPWTLINRLHREFDQADSAPRGPWTPAVDVLEEAERFVVHADLPGVDPKDIHVTAEDGVLLIRGTRAFAAREQGEGYERRERVAGAFERRFTLPETVRSEAITARHVNGVLEVALPKQAQPQPRRVNVEVN